MSPLSVILKLNGDIPLLARKDFSERKKTAVTVRPVAGPGPHRYVTEDSYMVFER